MSNTDFELIKYLILKLCKSFVIKHELVPRYFMSAIKQLFEDEGGIKRLRDINPIQQLNEHNGCSKCNKQKMITINLNISRRIPRLIDFFLFQFNLETNYLTSTCKSKIFSGQYFSTNVCHNIFVSKHFDRSFNLYLSACNLLYFFFILK